MMIKEVIGDILDCNETYIVHQCNCVTVTAAGLAYHIFKRFPESDVYHNNPRKRIPGTIEIRGRVIALYGQHNPGIGAFNEPREMWFKECLDELDKYLKPGDTVAFPFQIGCGLACGNWNNYYKMIETFATKHDVVIYTLEEMMMMRCKN